MTEATLANNGINPAAGEQVIKRDKRAGKPGPVQRLFDEVRRKMRAWEQANLGAKELQAAPPPEAAPEEFQY
jgi:hypothetical protein